MLPFFAKPDKLSQSFLPENSNILQFFSTPLLKSDECTTGESQNKEHRLLDLWEDGKAQLSGDHPKTKLEYSAPSHVWHIAVRKGVNCMQSREDRCK